MNSSAPVAVPSFVYRRSGDDATTGAKLEDVFIKGS
jgi:hypothetical protein